MLRSLSEEETNAHELPHCLCKHLLPGSTAINARDCRPSIPLEEPPPPPGASSLLPLPSQHSFVHLVCCARAAEAAAAFAVCVNVLIMTRGRGAPLALAMLSSSSPKTAPDPRSSRPPLSPLCESVCSSEYFTLCGNCRRTESSRTDLAQDRPRFGPFVRNDELGKASLRALSRLFRFIRLVFCRERARASSASSSWIRS